MRQSLTDAKIRRIKPGPKAVKQFDGGGLHLLVTTNGSRLWRLKFNLAGKEKLLALGSYPEVSLPEARQARDDARALVKRGVDPVHHRKAEKAKAEHAAGNTFATVAALYIEHARAKGRAEKTILKMEQHVRQAATLANRPIAAITPHELLTHLKAIAERTPSTAGKLKSFLGTLFRFAVANCYCDFDPTASLRGAIAVPPKVHFPAVIDPIEFGKLLRAVEAYRGKAGLLQTGFALRLAPHLALRPSELRCGQWSEVDFGKAVWTIPAERMKKRREHVVPLSRQVLEILTELKSITGNGEFLFPGRNGRCLSESALQVALAVVGYQGVQSLHGFRTSFSSMANVSGLWSEDAIERQLAHVDRNSIRGVYSRDAFWPERQCLMGWWSDQIDIMRAMLPAT